MGSLAVGGGPSCRGNTRCTGGQDFGSNVRLENPRLAAYDYLRALAARARLPASWK